MNAPALPTQPIEQLLCLLTTSGALDLQYQITPCAHITPEAPLEIFVELTGPDIALLTGRNGELLHAIEHIAAKILRLEPEEHDRISFDADHFKANRDRDLHLSAESAITRVRETGRAFAFPTMTSRERRMLHLALKPSGLPTASSGENPRRFVVLYPESHESSAPRAEQLIPNAPDRTHALRNTFRRR